MDAGLCPVNAGGRPTGFTLLEVLIAVAVLAILMMGLLSAATAGVRNLAYLENRTLAALIAANSAVELRLRGQASANAENVITLAGRRWRRRSERKAAAWQGVRRYQITVYLQGEQEPYASATCDLPER